MPRRALAVALVPVCALVSVVVQAKGFPYHFHPVTAGVRFQWLLLVAWLADRCRPPPRRTPRAPRARSPPPRSLALRVTTALSGLAARPARLWLAEKGMTPADREAHEFLVYFQTSDFFPWELRQAAAYLREPHAPDRPRPDLRHGPVRPLPRGAPERDAVHLRVRSQRRRRARRGMLHAAAPPERRASRRGSAPSATRTRPTSLARLEKDPPAAFVFIDGSPLITEARRLGGLPEPRSGSRGLGRASTTGRRRVFGHDHVWLRNDRAERNRRSRRPKSAGLDREVRARCSLRGASRRSSP